MMNPRVLTLAFVVALLAPVLADRPAGAQEAVDVLTTDIYPGACGDDFEDPAASLTQADLPAGEAEGAPDARPVATSFTTVPLSLEDLIAEDHVVATLGEDQETAACGAIGGPRTEAGAIVIELGEAGDSGISGVAYLAPSGAGPGQTDISLFLAGQEPAQPERPGEPTAAPTTESTAEVGQGATMEAMTEPDEAPTEATVRITRAGMDPDQVIIPAGGTVTWILRAMGASQVVVVVGDVASLAQPEVVEIARSDLLLQSPDSSFSHTFTEPGIYTAVDVTDATNRATITVEPPAGETAETSAAASQDASEEATEEPVEQAAATETYVSPSFGYSLSYDPTVWEVAEGPTTDANGIDLIALKAGFTTVDVIGIPGTFTDQAQTCVQTLTDAQTSEANVVAFEPLLDDAGVPEAGGDAGDAFATTRITRALESGATGDQAFYARCIVLPAGGVFTIQQFAAEAIYAAAAEDRELLLEGLTLP
jgi:plastocyanin